jgi:D-alanyl-D-alanine carboxypeptidase
MGLRSGLLGPAVLLLSGVAGIADIAGAAAPAPPGASAAPAALAARIDRYLAATYPAAEPGATVLVEKDGATLLRKGYGMANLELGVPLRPEMVFRVGSITKQFTAVAILQLAAQGKLALDDDITRYLPDLPTQGRTITLENLLTQTSGIKSYTSLDRWRARMREDISVAQMVDLLKNEPLDFAPGEKWLYSNSGYFLLGAVIEKVTGKPYAQYLAESLLAPLGLAHTSCDEDGPLVPGRVAGYEGTPGRYQNAAYLSMTHGLGAGALISNVDDLARWARALTSGALLRPDLFTRMTTSYHLKDGRPTGYGYGLVLWSYGGHRVIEHNGGINGFAAELLLLPDDHATVVVLSNNAGHQPNPDFVAAWIASLLVGQPLDERPQVRLEPALLDRYVGVYRINPTTIRVVTREGDRLYTERIPGGVKTEALAASATEFFYRDRLERLTFLQDAQGRVTGMQLAGPAGEPETAARTADPLPPGDRVP